MSSGDSRRDPATAPTSGAPTRLSLLARFLRWKESRWPDREVRDHRRRLLRGLTGSVIEIGCGEGANFRLYPPTVAHVVAVEPDPRARAAAEREAERAPAPIDVVAGVAEDLPVPDGSFDAAVCACVLCTVVDVPAALAEVKRVLRPDGQLRFYEHVRAATPALSFVQRLVDASFWPRMLGGCHTSRDTEAALRAAGFEITDVARFDHASSFLTVPASPQILGSATRRVLQDGRE